MVRAAQAALVALRSDIQIRMKCESHPDCDARLSPYDWTRVCEACFKLQATVRASYTPYKGKREAWEMTDAYDDRYYSDSKDPWAAPKQDERTWK